MLIQVYISSFPLNSSQLLHGHLNDVSRYEGAYTNALVLSILPISLIAMECMNPFNRLAWMGVF